MHPFLYSFYMASEGEVQDFFDTQNKCKYKGKVEFIHKSVIPEGECSGNYNYFVSSQNGYVFPGCSYLSEECVGDGPCGSSNLTEIYVPEPQIGDYIYGVMNQSGMILRVGKEDYNSSSKIPDCKTYQSLQDFQNAVGVKVDSQAPIYSPINKISIYYIIGAGIVGVLVCLGLIRILRGKNKSSS